MERPPGYHPELADVNISTFSFFINIHQHCPDSTSLSSETLLLAYETAHTTLVLSDSQLLDRARQLDEDIPEDDIVGLEERKYWNVRLLDMCQKRRLLYLSDGKSTSQEAETQALWELRQDIAARTFRLAYLRQRPAEAVAWHRYDKELLKAADLVRNATRLIWSELN